MAAGGEKGRGAGEEEDGGSDARAPAWSSHGLRQLFKEQTVGNFFRRAVSLNGGTCVFAAAA